MSDTAPTYEDADQLRKKRQYPEAAIAFASLWENHPGQMIGWRYAFCLRKLGKLTDAEKIAHDAREQYPQDQWTANELAWIIYEKELKPAKEEKDLGRAIHFGSEIIDLGVRDLALHLTVLLVMKVAKERGKWDVVLEWANKVQASELSLEPSEFEGKRSFANRETWYVGKSRALLELDRFNESRDCAEAGLIDFPEELFLKRTAAFALVGLGQLDNSIKEFEELLANPRADWYCKADLAELESRRGNDKAAYRLVCEALLASRQGNEFKLSAFITLAQIAVKLERFDIAAAHILLAKMIREHEGWKDQPENIALEQNLYSRMKTKGEVLPELPQNINGLETHCRNIWQKGVIEDLPRYRGVIKSLQADKKFTFIAREDGEPAIFALVRDIPHHLQKSGTIVEFSIEKSFDRKKGQESVRALYIQGIK
jgi:tetratricopeptide (TPR) repeat protein/cold shock CspA family protein